MRGALQGAACLFDASSRPAGDPFGAAADPLEATFTRIVAVVVRQEWVMVDGRKNVQSSAAGCRAACAVNARCTAWVWCARAGGCDDGKASSWPLTSVLLPGAPVRECATPSGEARGLSYGGQCVLRQSGAQDGVTSAL